MRAVGDPVMPICDGCGTQVVDDVYSLALTTTDGTQDAARQP